jgi:hypothetical protein
LEAGIALLWQNQTWRIHVRKRSSPEGVPSGERYRRMTMAVSHKLTHVVKDRVVQSFQVDGSELLISFIDGSTMKVTIVESNNNYRLMYDKSKRVNSGSATARCILF